MSRNDATTFLRSCRLAAFITAAGAVVTLLFAQSDTVPEIAPPPGSAGNATEADTAVLKDAAASGNDAAAVLPDTAAHAATLLPLPAPATPYDSSAAIVNPGTANDTVATTGPAGPPPDTDAVAIVVEGVLISRADGEPPTGDAIAVTVDSAAVPVSPSGEFSRIVTPRNFYTVEVHAKNYAPVRRTVTFTPGKTNYFLTILLDNEAPAPPASPPVSAAAAEIPWTVSGTIVDSRFDLAIESDSITLLFDGNKVPVSKKGNFVVTTRQPGIHTFFTSIPGYQQVSESVTLSGGDKQPYITIPTTIAGRTITRREITVTAARLPVHRSASVAKTAVSRRELQRATATMNDPLRALQTLPGVAAESDVAARPVIRGGDVLESRVFLDGVTMIQPYHFGGVRSTFNQMGIRGLTLYKSGFPAEFHNAQSGIIDASGRLPSDEKPSFEADINYLQYCAYLGVPLFKGKAGLNVSSQGSYFDAVSKLIYNIIAKTTNDQDISNWSKLINMPDYRDFSVGFSLTPTPSLKIFINEVLNTDRTKFCQGDSAADVTYQYVEARHYRNDGSWTVLPETTITVSQVYISRYGYDYIYFQPLNGRALADDPAVGKPYYDIDTMMNYRSRYNILYGTAQYAPSDRHLITLTAAWQRRWWDLDFPTLNDFFDTTIYDVAINQYNGNLGWVYSGLSGHIVKSGLQIDYTRARYDVFIVRYLHEMIVSGSTNLTDFWGPVNGDTAFTVGGEKDAEWYLYNLMGQMLVNYKGDRRYYNVGYYLSDSWDVLPRLHLDIGTRVEYSSSDHATCLSPRFALRYNAADNHELICSAGHYTQNNYDISAIALAEDLKPEKVVHGSVGMESKLLPWLTRKIDIYAKYYYDLLSEVLTPFREIRINPYDVIPRDSSFDSSGETRQPDIRDILLDNNLFRSTYVNDGRGYAFGAEYMLRFDPFDFWNGWISLSWGRSVRERREGWRKHPFPLDRPLLISLHNYYRLPRKYEIGLKYRYMSGLPYTSVATAPDSSGITIGDFNDRRYAAYHRFDIRFTKGFSIKDAKGHFYLEIWNSMNAPNLFQRDAKTEKLITFTSNFPTTMLFVGIDCIY